MTSARLVVGEAIGHIAVRKTKNKKSKRLTHVEEDMPKPKHIKTRKNI